ncbi:MAG TPA: hypothetical protein VJ846_11345 [Sphingomicrobium sp.]|nr:hypothetical protein [Sphingomicrobium sp.]
MIGNVALMEAVGITNRIWHGTAAGLILAAIIVLGVFVTFRPL